MERLEQQDREQLVLAIQKMISDKKEKTNNDIVAQSIANRTNMMMGLGIGMQSVAMVAGIFMDSEDAMQAQMLLMIPTMGLMTVQMITMAKSMAKTAEQSIILGRALGWGALIGIIVAIVGSKMIPNMSNDFETLGDAINYTAVSAADLERGLEFYGDMSLVEITNERRNIEEEILYLKERAKNASGAELAIIEQSITN